MDKSIIDPDDLAWNGAERCRHIKKDGERCQAPSVRDDATGEYRGFCRTHGGKSPGAPLTSGRYTRYLPPSLIPRYRQVLADPSFMSLRRNIALLSARATQLIQMLPATDDAEYQELVDQAHSAFELCRRGHQSDVSENRQQGIELLAELLEAEEYETRVWDQLLKIIEQIRSQVASELSRLRVTEQLIHKKQATALQVFMVDTVTRHVGDASVIEQIDQEFRRRLAAHAAIGQESLLPVAASGRADKDYALPKDLIPHYAAAIEDTSLLVLQSNIALIGLRITQLVEQRLPRGEGENTAAMSVLNEGYRLFREGHYKGETWPRELGLEALQKALEPFEVEMEVWEEIIHLDELQRKLIGTESRRLNVAKNYIPVEQVLAISQILLESIKPFVELSTLAGIHRDFTTYIYH